MTRDYDARAAHDQMWWPSVNRSAGGEPKCWQREGRRRTSQFQLRGSGSGGPLTPPRVAAVMGHRQREADAETFLWGIRSGEAVDSGMSSPALGWDTVP